MHTCTVVCTFVCVCMCVCVSFCCCNGKICAGSVAEVLMLSARRDIFTRLCPVCDIRECFTGLSAFVSGVRYQFM